MSVIKRMTSVLLMVLALFGGVATMNASAAVAAAPQVVQQSGDEVGVQATYRCDWRATTQRVDATCTVVSGEVRMYGRCSNGGTYYTPWVGPAAGTSG
ncbi:hypothetical protein [Lentzea indica]|nr:hypothetical protein [Lentzea indica]